MKQFIYTISLFTLLFSANALADTCQIGGNVFECQSVYVEFIQGPFGPNESGTVTIEDGNKKLNMSYSFECPVVNIDGVKLILGIDENLYYIDPCGVVLTFIKKNNFW